MDKSNTGIIDFGVHSEMELTSSGKELYWTGILSKSVYPRHRHSWPSGS